MWRRLDDSPRGNFGRCIAIQSTCRSPTTQRGNARQGPRQVPRVARPGPRRVPEWFSRQALALSPAAVAREAAGHPPGAQGGRGRHQAVVARAVRADAAARRQQP
eukprot:880992-Prymnesium_polylepis.1